uniref:Putative secreted peptide n=1 Tax=Anopheles braziliensis TaxID=58242 RepID=A0A2M3ZXE9_9DIPT
MVKIKKSIFSMFISICSCATNCALWTGASVRIVTLNIDDRYARAMFGRKQASRFYLEFAKQTTNTLFVCRSLTCPTANLISHVFTF